MSEIEKMYENVGIEKEVIRGCYEYYTENGGIDIYTINDCKNKDCNTCKADKSIKRYPPFTAEKQILLIQWLLDKTDLYLHRHKTDFTYSIASGNYAVNKYKKFKESIAEFINAIWQDLTEEEKTSIKNILEM